MATKRILTSVSFIVGVTLALLEIGCSFESVPADRRRQTEAARDEYERKSQAESVASDRQRTDEIWRMMADPGSLSIQQSDALIEALRSPSSLTRTSAAQKLGDAKGARAVDALVAVLRTETDPTTFSAIVEALVNIGNPRATDAFVEALSAPNMPDAARENALDAIVEFRSDWRFRPQIQRFYDSLTDESVRTRVRLVVEGHSKLTNAR